MERPAPIGSATAGETEPGSVEATLTLADWRRTIAALYVDVRRLAAEDPAAALELWRSTRERLYREHPQSPVPADSRRQFRAAHFDHDPRLRFEVVVDTPPPTETDAATSGGLAIDLPVSAGGTMAFHRFGVVTVPFDDRPLQLEIYWMAGYAGGLFLPFRDATNGRETYSAGRYLLDAAKGADLGPGRASGSLILDFNFAFQPSCAFDPKWACPLAPPANRLGVAVRAGERLG